MSLTAFAPTMYQAFLLNRFVSTGVEYFDHDTNGMWMKTTLASPNKYPLASSALLTLAECFYGCNNHVDVIATSSMRSYGTVVRVVRSSLTAQTPSLTYDMVAAVTSLYLLECFYFTSNKAWLQHADAVSRMIQALGCDAFRDAPACYLLESIREPLICAAIVERKRTFLQEEEWKMRTHQDDTLSCSIAELNHLYAKLPYLAEKLLNLQSRQIAHACGLYGVKVLQQEIDDTQARLDAWHLKWTRLHWKDLRTAPTTMFAMEYPELTATLGTLYTFHDLKVARVFLNYWMIGILLYLQKRKLRRILHQDDTPFQDVEFNSLARDLALKICRSVRFFMQPIHIESASFYLSVPIRAAYLALVPSSVEAQWLDMTRSSLADLSGVGILRNIFDNIPMRRPS